MSIIANSEDGRGYIQRLLEAFGLENDRRIFSITISITPDAPVSLTISKYMQNDEFSNLVAVVEEFKFQAVP